MKRQRITGRQLQKSIIDVAHLHQWRDCISGTGTKNHGYFRQMRNGVRRDQHVWAWMDAHGRPVPERHEVHHLCENKECVNPQHLVVVTPAEHMIIHRKLDVCKYGHSRINNTTRSGNCKTCMKEYLREYRKTYIRPKKRVA